LNKAIRFKLAVTNDFTGDEQHKEANSLNRDLGTEDGKHYLLKKEGVVEVKDDLTKLRPTSDGGVGASGTDGPDGK
jgi:hypothetical protein